MQVLGPFEATHAKTCSDRDEQPEASAERNAIKDVAWRREREPGRTSQRKRSAQSVREERREERHARVCGSEAAPTRHGSEHYATRTNGCRAERRVSGRDAPPL